MNMKLEELQLGSKTLKDEMGTFSRTVKTVDELQKTLMKHQGDYATYQVTVDTMNRKTQSEIEKVAYEMGKT
jgi:hypothetical protein